MRSMKSSMLANQLFGLSRDFGYCENSVYILNNFAVKNNKRQVTKVTTSHYYHKIIFTVSFGITCHRTNL